MPPVDDVTATEKDGTAADGLLIEIIGAGTLPKFNGLPMPVLGAGVNCLTL
jgi:hypothetical protein